ncbi:MAG: type II toxin-antitoxin system RelE/ParE family toxin [Bacteroidales bacterium]|nr:type II toxin-antitoxin system RelE/ParE family toxin [Bacteroidales bacterium]
MDDKKNFEILMLKDALDFLKQQDIKVIKKIRSNIDKAKETSDTRLFKKLVNTDIWEFRTSLNRMEYRMLAFWDKTQKKLVVVSNGFVKKSQKTPEKEIKKAEQIMKLYYKQK